MLAARTTFFLQIFILAALAFVTGCETMPVQEMSDARQAITAARHAGAEEYASGELLAAETALQSAEESLSAEDYAGARREAIEAKSRALEALRVSEAAGGSED